MSARQAIEDALRVDDETERLLEVAAVVEEALGEIGVHPVVVGGLAVAYWTGGAYLTGDIDVVMPSTPEVDARMAELGFERRGRFWVLPEAGLFFEAPGSALAPGEEAVDAELGSGRTVRVLRAEDGLVHRLHEFVATGHADAFRQAVALLGTPGLDRGRLVARARDERLEDALGALQTLADRVREGSWPETWELHDVARRLRSRRLE